MAKSGLSHILETIYGTNAVVHMLTGKAYSRAIRGHLLVDQNLSSNLIENLDIQEKHCFEEIYSSLLNKSITIEDIENNEYINRIHSELDILKEQLSTSSRTAKLWISYQKVITIIKKLIRADRLGQWHLYTFRSFARVAAYICSSWPLSTKNARSWK